MLLASIYFIENPKNVKGDTSIEFRSRKNSADFVHIIHRPSDCNTTYATWMTRPEALRYVRNMLDAVRYDIDPPAQFQISPSMGPRVLYSMDDLRSHIVRDLIEDALEDALRFVVKATPRDDDENIQD